MLHTVLRMELKRAFWNKMFVVALGIGLALALLQLAVVVVPYACSDAWAMWRSGAQGAYPPSFYSSWMGVTGYSIFSSLYYFTLPLLVCLPHSASLFYDIKSGYIKNVTTRTNPADYYVAKIISVFLSAGAVAIIPLVVNLFGTMLFLPLLAPEPSAGIFFGGAKMWLDIYYSAPNLYILRYLILTFSVSGVIALCAVATGFFVSNTLMVLVAPFALSVFVSFVAGSSAIAQYSPVNLLSPYSAANTQDVWVAAIYAGLCIAFVSLTSLQMHRSKTTLRGV